MMPCRGNFLRSEGLTLENNTTGVGRNVQKSLQPLNASFAGAWFFVFFGKYIFSYIYIIYTDWGIAVSVSGKGAARGATAGALLYGPVQRRSSSICSVLYPEYQVLFPRALAGTIV